MMPAVRPLVAALALLSFTAVAQPAPVASGAKPEAEASAEKKISIEYRGALRDALRQIASKGGINLVVSGGLDQSAEVYLKDVTPEEALRTVAEAYDLKIASSGRIWTLRPMTPAEKASEANAPARPSPAPGPQNVPGVQLTPPLPPVPPSQVGPDEDAEDRAEQLREEAEERAEAARDAAEEQREQERERQDVQRKIDRKLRKIDRHHGDNDFVTYGSGGPAEIKEGQTVDNAVVYGGTLTVNGHVEGDAVVFGGNLHLGKTAVIEGDMVSLGGTITRDEGSVVEGDVVSMNGLGIGRLVTGLKHGPSVRIDSDDGDRGSHHGPSLPGFLVWFAAMFGTGFFAMMLAPNRMKQVENELHRDPLKCGLTGLIALVAIVPLTVLLIVTIVGIPVAVLLWVVAPVAALLGLAVVASEIGLRLPVFRGRKTQAVVLALGTLVILLVGLIPYVGAVVVFILGLLGLGAIVRTRFGIRPKGFPEPVI